MVAEASGPRARRARRRADVIAPRSLIGVVLVGTALAVIAAFGAGWWVGQRGGPSSAGRASPLDTTPQVAAAVTPVTPVTPPRAVVAPTTTTSSAVARVSLVVSSSTAGGSASPAPDSAVVAVPPGAHASSAPPTSAPGGVPAAPDVDVRTRAPSRGYGVQLGAFETEAEARDFVAAHAAGLARLPVYLVPTTLEGRGTWHRVRAGDVKTRAAAETLRAALAPELAARAIVVSHK